MDIPIENQNLGAEDRKFGAGAVSGFASQARQLIENYYRQRHKPLDEMEETAPARIVVDHLNRIAAEAYRISQLPEDQQIEAFGKFVADAEKKVTHGLASAYMAAKVIVDKDDVIPSGYDEAGAKLPPTEGISTKADAELLIKPLKAALAHAGYSFGVYMQRTDGHRMPIPDRLNSLGPGRLFDNFKNSMQKMFGGATLDVANSARSEVILAYSGGFHAGRRNDHPRINPERQRGIGNVD